MIRRALWILLITAIAGVAHGLLVPISFDEFSRLAPCSCVVEVTSVAEVGFEQLVAMEIPEGERAGLTRVAQLNVDRWIADECNRASDFDSLLFSTEVHSSTPRPGSRYIVFPRSVGNAWTEAVYGRSVWEITTDEEVVVDWRNGFLIVPLYLRSGEVVLVPLTAVERLLRSR